jgi:hypothetical protein
MRLDLALVSYFEFLSNNHFWGSWGWQHPTNTYCLSPHAPICSPQETKAMQSFVAAYLDFGPQQLKLGNLLLSSTGAKLLVPTKVMWSIHVKTNKQTCDLEFQTPIVYGRSSNPNPFLLGSTYPLINPNRIGKFLTRLHIVTLIQTMKPVLSFWGLTAKF